MQADGAPAGFKLTWFVNWFSYMGLVIILSSTAFMVLSGREPAVIGAELRVIFWVIAIVSMIASIVVTGLFVRPRAQIGAEPEVKPAGHFQTYSVIAMALAEVPVLLGFVLSMLMSDPAQVLPLAAGSLGVHLAVILPAGLEYWRHHNARPPEAPL
jgi:F0F1-type ATP synthase membrane subunit c/vacuolar-type H+-ATPase subunit K